MRDSAGGSDTEQAEIPPASLTMTLRKRIEDMILTGAIPAGARLNENALATQLRVSRGPVREAARMLEQVGLVKVVRNRGVFVRSVSLKEALDLYDVRAGLARTAGRLLATRISRAQLEILGELNRRLTDAARSEDAAAYQHINFDYHAKLIEFTGNSRLIAINEGLAKELQLFVRRGIFHPSQLRVSQAQHQEIYDRVAAGDGDGAGAAFEHHIVTGKQRMLDTLAGETD